MDGNGNDRNLDVRRLSSAELLMLLHNIWVELHNRLNFGYQAPGPASDPSGTPLPSPDPDPNPPSGTSSSAPDLAPGHTETESSVTPFVCDQYCDWCQRWCGRRRIGHRHHSCFNHRHWR